MATTNFAALTNEQYTVWSRDFWREARNRTFVMSFAGDSENSMIQRITELRKTTDGARAVVTLINEATGDGTVGDNELDGNEEALGSSDMVIQLDQWRHAHKSAGRMSEQRSIVKFRTEAKNQLAYTASRVMDELAFQTMSGWNYSLRPNGATRVGSQLSLLRFAGDVTAPSSRRHYRWDSTSGGSLKAGATNAVTAADTPTWNMLLEAKSKAVEEFIRPLRSDDGVECYNVFMTPGAILKLKKDPDFREAMQTAQKRGDTNPLFKGTKHGGKEGIFIDGLNILEYRNVCNTKGFASGSKWGAAGDVEGNRILLCGAQALAFADIGTAEWEEEYKDYKNRLGISIAKIFGMLKPQLFSTYAQSKQDFGLLCIDTAI
jgi:N4-gp56 family major capsid protein